MKIQDYPCPKCNYIKKKLVSFIESNMNKEGIKMKRIMDVYKCEKCDYVMGFFLE